MGLVVRHLSCDRLDLVLSAMPRPRRSGEIAFSAHKLTSQTWVEGGDTILFEDVLTNIGDLYSPALGEFTAGLPGVYYFNVGLQVYF